MTRRPQPNAGRARLHVLATGDQRRFRELAAEMLASPRRLDREAALEALTEHPAHELRGALRALFFELEQDGPKRDQGAAMRIGIVKILRALGDARDADIGAHATDTYEQIMGDDTSWELRAQGLMLLAAAEPGMFPFYAVDCMGERDFSGPDGTEPASTAIQLLAGTGNTVALYQWLLAQSPGAALTHSVFDLVAEQAPREIVQRYVSSALTSALRRSDEALCTVLVESIVRRELEAAYSVIEQLLFAKISPELYAYVAMLLAGTNRPELLAILEGQLHRGRHQQLIVEALSVRATAEQAAILERWEGA